MKLWEAISLGATMLPKSRSLYVRYGIDRQPCEACALGSAALALGGSARCDDIARLMTRFPVLAEVTTNPVDGTRERVRDIIEFSLNWGDGTYDDWTREQIADWLKPIEEAYLAQQAHDAHVAAIKARLDEAEMPVVSR